MGKVSFAAPKIAPPILTSETLVPLENACRKEGMEFSLNPDSNKIAVKKEGLNIDLEIGKRAIYVNGKLDTINSPPIILGGNVVVPFGFIEYIDGIDKRFEQISNNITKEDMSKIIEDKSKEFISKSSKKDFIRFIIDGNILRLKGKKTYDSGVYNITINNKKSGMGFYIDSGEFKNGNIDAKIELSHLSKDEFGGKNLLTIITAPKSNNLNYKYIPAESTEIYIMADDKGFTFHIPVTFEENYLNMLKVQNLNPKDYLGLEYMDEKENMELGALARSIIKGIDSEYERLEAIHDWVAENIYYDYDTYYGLIDSSADAQNLDSKYEFSSNAYRAYKNRYAVCQGYAELTLALCREVGIPTILIHGKALGGKVMGEWEDTQDFRGTGHAWNGMFVDNRWIIIDSTWASGNEYRNGEFIKGQKKNKYFDMSLDLLSKTHRIEDIRGY